MKKILLIDGLNLIIRNFIAHGTCNEDGDHVSALFGSLMSIRKAINDTIPNRVIFVWDGPGGSTRRRHLYSEYKERRKVSTRMTSFEFYDTPEEEKKSLYRQSNRLKEYLSNLPIDQIQIENVEADDVIACMTNQCKKEYKVIILSMDKDYLQLIDNNVSQYTPIKNILVDENVMKEMYSEGVPPINFALLRTFLGDASDNIQGIKGIGIKTAVKLYPELLSDEKITINQIKKSSEDNIGKFKGYKTVLDNIDIVERNYRLMQLYDTNLSVDEIRQIQNFLNTSCNSINQISLMKMMKEDKIQSIIENQRIFFDTFIQLHGRTMLENKLNSLCQ